MLAGSLAPPTEWPLSMEALLGEDEARYEAKRQSEERTIKLDELDVGGDDDE